MPNYGVDKNFKWVDNKSMAIDSQIAILSVAQRLLNDTIETLESVYAPGNEFQNVLISVLKDMRGNESRFGTDVCLRNWRRALEAAQDQELEREPVLCYIDGETAFFTTQPLDKQWGDDWDDAPYQHNAGRPYDHRASMELRPYQIVQVLFRCHPLKTPADRELNISVKSINEVGVPWLRSGDGQTVIFGGCTLSNFKEIVRSIGGKVFVEEP